MHPSRESRGSLERRLLWRLAAGAGLSLAIAGFVLVRLVEVRVRSDFDRLLGDRARALASLAEQENGQLWLEFDPDAYPEFLPGARSEFFEFRDDSGQLISSSPSTTGRRLAVDSPAHGSRDPLFLNSILPDGRSGRAVALRFVPRAEHPDDEEFPAVPLVGDAASSIRVRPSADSPHSPVSAVREAEIVVARDLESLDGFLRRVRQTAVITIGGFLPGLVLLIGWTLRRELRRVRILTDRLRTIDAASLDRPLGTIPLPSELRPIVQRIEELLERLHSSFEREREFSRHLAHELRTPLAEMRTSIDVAVRWPEGREELLETLREVGSVGAQMERLLSNLLVLARADAGIEGLRAREVRISDELAQALENFAARLELRGISVRNRVTPDARVVVPEAVLSLILRNLVANAAEHADRSSWLEISFDPERGAIAFRNPASDLRAGDLPSLFERFWRKRSDRLLGEHAGLGLSLVRKLARAIGGDATADLENGVLVVTIRGFHGPTGGEATAVGPVS